MRALRSTRMRSLVAPLVLILLSFLSVFVHVPGNSALSPIDEFVYVDYLDKVPTELVVAQGESTGQYAREEWLCKGVRLVQDPRPAECAELGTGAEPAVAWPFEGKTSADIYTPLYFAVTWVLAQPFRLLGVSDLADAASYAGALWLSAGMLFLFAALRRIGVGRVLAVSLGAVLIATPAVFWSSTYVSTDAPSLAIGAALVWLAVRIMQGTSGRIALVAVSFLGVLLKVQNILAVALVGLALIGHALSSAWRRRREEPDGGWFWRTLATRDVVTAVLAVILSAAGQVAWLAVRAAISSGPSPDQGVGAPLSVAALVREALKFLPDAATDPTGGANSIALVVAGTIVSWISIMGVLWLTVAGREGTPEVWIARSALVVSVIGGPLLVASTVLVSGYYFQLPVRYGIVLIPAFLLAASVVLKERRWVVWSFATISGLVYLAALAGT